ncbi:MAG: threonylcarbamoyl-AMP synthase [Bifidobacterium sp.]|jgi:tRNA threonylcarbamoyl adenosine modification protein (Sua5/YciO/YrdC/YwlC family)|nr:threonylcarbamoyl-AMP synthase [Bifidobacterium sp.]MCH4175068.1 threonylcarbamoyl-AMP synthase [Bifidobacterium sp.]
MTSGESERVRPITPETLSLAAKLIQRGEIIVMPTDTVYGVAADPFNEQAIDRIFQAKQRPRTKALQVLLPSVEAIDELFLELPAPLDVLANAFLPGAFSPICEAQAKCTLVTIHEVGNLKTQGVRVPDSKACRQVLRATGPLAASSANRSGLPSAQTAQEAYEQLGDSVALYLDAGATPGPVASTVVAASQSGADGIEILRAGVISEESIRAALASALGDHRRNSDSENIEQTVAENMGNAQA